MTDCYRCGDNDHLSRDCPQMASPHAAHPPAADPDGTAGLTAWCGTCDKRTRLVDHGTTMARCIRCHPRAHQQLPQHRLCSGCGHQIYVWDQMPCGNHQAIRPPGIRPVIPENGT